MHPHGFSGSSAGVPVDPYDGAAFTGPMAPSGHAVSAHPSGLFSAGGAAIPGPFALLPAAPPVGFDQPFPPQPFPMQPGMSQPFPAPPGSTQPGVARSGPLPAGFAPLAPMPFGAPWAGAPYPSTPYSPYPGRPWGPQRPGQVTWTSVLCYIQAGLLIVAALFVFAGASIIEVAEHSAGAYDGGLPAQFVLAGLANLVTAALLIASGVMLSSANPTGIRLLIVAAALIAVTALFYVVRFSSATLVWYAIGFLIMPTIAVILAFSAPVKAWLAPRR